MNMFQMNCNWFESVGLGYGSGNGEEVVNDWGRTSVSSSTFSGFPPIGDNIST